MEQFKKALEKKDEHRQKYLDQCPDSYKKTLKLAYGGKSKNAAIKAFCRQCVGYSMVDVRLCTAVGCPLWEHRPYQDKAETKKSGRVLSDEEKKIISERFKKAREKKKEL